MTAATVTAAIPTYNRSESLNRAIAGVFAQTFGDFELLILDDASTDDTRDVVRSWVDDRLRYVRHPANIGMVANWNRAFELARGRYVGLLHDDDRWAPSFLERALGLFDKRPDLGFVYSASLSELALARHDRIFEPEQGLDQLRRRNEVADEAVLVRRDALLQIGGFRGRWPFSMDWEAWLKIAARYPVGYVAEVLGYKGSHDGQLTERMHRTPLAIARDKLGMLEETIPALPLSAARRDRLLASAMRSLAQAQLVTAWDIAAAGRKSRALKEANFAFRIDRRVALRSPLQVAAMYAGLALPSPVLRRLNRLRGPVRPIFRPD